MNRKPWPEYASTEYYNLVASTEGLTYLSNILVSRAVFGIRNTSLLEQLFQIIPTELRRIKQSCIIANKKRSHPTSGRYPQWVVAMLENSIISLQKLTEGLEMIKTAYEKSNWDLIENLAHLIHRDALDLQQELLSGPPPITKEPDAISQIVNLADMAWQTWEGN